MEEKEEGRSKYSSGVNIIIRLDELWKQTHALTLEGKYKLWNIVLDRIWLELARDIKEKNKEKEKNFAEKEDKFKEFEAELLEAGEIQDNRKPGFEKTNADEIKKRDKHYKTLMQKQLFLARLENELGKGTTIDHDDDEID